MLFKQYRLIKRTYLDTNFPLWIIQKRSLSTFFLWEYVTGFSERDKALEILRRLLGGEPLFKDDNISI